MGADVNSGYSFKFVKRRVGELSSFYVTFGIWSVGTLALISRLEDSGRGSLFCRWLGARWRWRLIEAFVIVVKEAPAAGNNNTLRTGIARRLR